LDKVLQGLEGVRRNGSGFKARCPGHEDREPSLSVQEGDDGRILLKCFAGCSTETVVEAMGLRMADLFPESPNGSGRKKKIAATYDYPDADGRSLFQTVRYEPKDFRQRRPDGRGGWAWNLKGIEPVLYRLPEVLRAVESDETVFVGEGEKDANRLADLGLTATTNPLGAGKWRRSYSETLRGANVIVVADNDTAGRKHVERVAQDLKGKAASVKVLELPGLPDKGDASDWVDGGGTVEELERLARETPEWEPQEASAEPVGQLLSWVAAERVDWLWHGRIPLGKITVIDGDPGLGKSALTTDLAARVSVGRDWPDGTPCPAGGAVLLSAEDGLADTVRPRLDAADGDPERVLALATLRDGDGERLLTIPGDLDIIRRGIERVKALVVVIDPMMAFLGPDVNSHRDQDVRRALTSVGKLAEKKKVAVLIVRHLNKGGGGNPLYRGGGSIGIVGAARSALVVAQDPDHDKRRILAPLKSNLAEPVPSLAFELTGAANGAVCVEYKGTSSLAADTLLAVPLDPEEKSALTEAKEFVSDELADGPMAANQVKKNARDADISERTLKRAKAALSILSKKEGDGSWTWSLPGKEAEEDHSPTVGPLGTLGTLPINKPNEAENKGGQAKDVGPLQNGSHSPYLSEEGQGGQGGQRKECGPLEQDGQGSFEGVDGDHLEKDTVSEGEEVARFFVDPPVWFRTQAKICADAGSPDRLLNPLANAASVVLYGTPWRWKEIKPRVAEFVEGGEAVNT
jgi:hypothetical protein